MLASVVSYKRRKKAKGRLVAGTFVAWNHVTVEWLALPSDSDEFNDTKENFGQVLQLVVTKIRTPGISSELARVLCPSCGSEGTRRASLSAMRSEAAAAVLNGTLLSTFRPVFTCK